MIGCGTGTPRKPREKRWEEEASFFDEVARRTDAAALPLDPLAVQRYSRPMLRKRFSMEWRFRILRPLAGKTILDVGCGDGLNAVLFAKMGAKVTGIDLSPQAIEVARLRARVNGVADRVAFVCAPIETADLAENSFDVVWGDAILHHVLDELDLVLRHLVRCTKPGGLLVFSEPVNLFEPIRRLRRLIPVHTEATPGERPLVRAETDFLRRYIPDLRMRYYTLFGRFDRFVLIRFNYERSPAIRRAIASWIGLLDYVLLSLPLVKNLAGTCVMWGYPNKASLSLSEVRTREDK